MTQAPPSDSTPQSMPLLVKLIFSSRWLQLPLYLGLIGISSIHLLKTFINAANYTDKLLIAQTAIHFTFLPSAMAIAFTDRLMTPSNKAPH